MNILVCFRVSDGAARSGECFQETFQRNMEPAIYVPLTLNTNDALSKTEKWARTARLRIHVLTPLLYFFIFSFQLSLFFSTALHTSTSTLSYSTCIPYTLRTRTRLLFSSQHHMYACKGLIRHYGKPGCRRSCRTVTAITYKTKTKKTDLQLMRLLNIAAAPYDCVDRYQCFGGTWRPHLQDAT